MKLLLAVAAVLALAGPARAQPPASPPAGDSDAAAQGDGKGVVKSVDAKGGSVILQHGPIPALSWPAMTMTFKADPALIKDVKPGERVEFTVRTGSTPQILALKPGA